MSCLVAHRGQSLSIPENTIESIQAAINCGAKAVEFDIQMTADGIPVLSHDVSLLNTAGVNLKLSEMNYADVKKISVHEAARFGGKFRAVSLPSLEDIVTVLKAASQVTAFVELKDDGIEHSGTEPYLKSVLAQLEPVRNQCVLIADNLQVLLRAKEISSLPIGWIIHSWSSDNLNLAKQSELNYLVINHEYCAGVNHDFASDTWSWVMYETCNADVAVGLFNLGVRYVESNDICSMLKQLPEYK